jgi:release factor glutamine methyltransferase
LIEAAVEHFGTAGPGTVLDLGTGPGTLLLAALAEWPVARGIGIDCSEAALRFARANAEALGLADRTDFREGDWTEGVSGSFDLILCNPPYVETSADLPRDVAHWEPAGALFAGADGLDDYRRLAPAIPPLIAPGGIACIEVGAGQAASVIALFEAQGVTAMSRKDLNGHDRCIVIRP